jgi:pyruvate formate lyase activating enzyme
VDTAGNYPWKLLESLLPHLDVVMYDLKVLDPERHRRYIGNDGSLIRENLQRLMATGCPLIVRTPVVGGVNDTVEEIGGIAAFIGSADSLQYYELLPYHALGDAKLQSLGLARNGQFYTPTADQLQVLADVARQYVGEVRPYSTDPSTNSQRTIK